MRRFLMLACMLAAACGGEATGPNARWVGTWRLVTVNGQPLPATVGYIGWDVDFEFRTLTLRADGSGSYSDGTRSGLYCFTYSPGDPLCDSPYSARLTYFASDDGSGLTVVTDPSAFLDGLTMTFAAQSDGTLLERDENLMEVYRKE